MELEQEQGEQSNTACYMGQKSTQHAAAAAAAATTSSTSTTSIDCRNVCRTGACALLYCRGSAGREEEGRRRREAAGECVS